MSLENNWRRKKIPTSVNSALASRVKFSTDYKNFFEQGGELFKTEHALIIETWEYLYEMWNLMYESHVDAKVRIPESSSSSSIRGAWYHMCCQSYVTQSVSNCVKNECRRKLVEVLFLATATFNKINGFRCCYTTIVTWRVSSHTSWGLNIHGGLFLIT